MLLAGSKVIRIECLKCGKKSLPFRVTLWHEEKGDEVGFFTWKARALPKGWEIPDEEELWPSGNGVYGYCMCNETAK
jgi:hypothetical protein